MDRNEAGQKFHINQRNQPIVVVLLWSLFSAIIRYGICYFAILIISILIGTIYFNSTLVSMREKLKFATRTHPQMTHQSSIFASDEMNYHLLFLRQLNRIHFFFQIFIMCNKFMDFEFACV